MKNSSNEGIFIFDFLNKFSMSHIFYAQAGRWIVRTTVYICHGCLGYVLILKKCPKKKRTINSLNNGGGQTSNFHERNF